MIGSGDGDEDRGGGLRCFQRTVLRIWLLWLENHSNFLVCVFVSIEVPSLGEIQAKRAGAGGFLKGGQWGQSFRDKLSYKNYPRVSYLGPSKLYLKDLNRLSLVFLFIYFNEFSFGASAYSGFQPPTYLFFHWNCWVIGSGEQIWILTMFYFSRKRERTSRNSFLNPSGRWKFSTRKICSRYVAYQSFFFENTAEWSKLCCLFSA